MRWFLGALLVLSQTSAPPSTAQPDFYLAMEKCSTTVGYFRLSDQSLRTIEGAPATNACWRTGKAVSCKMSFDDGGAGVKGDAARYAIFLDSPPLLMFADEVTGEMFAINTVAHAAVLVSRIVDKEFAGAKVCHGLFATQSEMEGLQKERQTPRRWTCPTTPHVVTSWLRSRSGRYFCQACIQPENESCARQSG